MRVLEAVALTAGRSIAHDVVAVGLGRALSRVLLLGVLLVLSRTVSVAEFGIFGFGLAMGELIAVIADGGAGYLMTRQVARRPHRRLRFQRGLWVLRGAWS